MDQIRKVFSSEIKSIDEKEMTLTASISTDARDRMNESLDPDGVDLTNYRKNPVVLWAHDYSSPPIGKALWVKKDGKSVISKVKFASTAFAQEIFQLYKEGILRAFSVGFIPKQTEDGDGDKKPRRTYKKWELLEYSAVPVPANPEALTLAIQRGLIKSESIKSLIAGTDEEKPEPEPEPEPEPIVEPEPEKEELPKEEEPKKEALEDLLAENKLLQEKIINLENEVKEAKYKLYQTLIKQHTALSEIAVDSLAGKAVEIMDGVIRKAKGQV
jgi:HK97 family phage prohead protease